MDWSHGLIKIFIHSFIQVATMLAWEAFHAGFRNMTLNANVNLNPPDDEKPKRGETQQLTIMERNIH